MCEKICDGDLAYVKDWCDKDDSPIDRRDHTGKTPLQLAAQCSTPEIVACLVENGARIVARLVDGMTALHIAAARGNAEMVRILLEKSEANEEAEAEKETQKKSSKMAAQAQDTTQDEATADSDEDKMSVDDDDASSNGESTTMTEGSFVKVKGEENTEAQTLPEDGETSDPDIYDVNVVAWDAPVSPLHLAILGGHLEVIQLLVSQFGADVLLPIKHINSYTRNPAKAILNLVLAAQVPEPDGSDVCKSLLSLGASTAQADMNQISAIHYLVAMLKIDALKACIDADGPAAKAALSHVFIDSPRWNPDIETPLTTAIRLGDSKLVMFLLENGAPSTIEKDKFGSSYAYAIENEQYPSFGKTDSSIAFRRDLTQPVILAVKAEIPDMVSALLDLGADVNTLDVDAQQCVYDYEENGRGQMNGKSLLDLINSKIRKLKKDEEKNSDIPDPDFPKYEEISHPKTYQDWHKSRDAERFNAAIRIWKQEKPEKVAKHEDQQGLKEKGAAIRDLKDRMEALQKQVVSRGAKTLKELYPNIPSKEEEEHEPEHTPKMPEAGEIGFEMVHATDLQKNGYLQLFEAAWQGDADKIKALTLASWGEGQNSPLQITVQDKKGFSPFSIAVYRRHTEVARLILEIARAQYKPKDGDTSRRFTMNRHEDGDDEMDSDSDDLDISSDLVDDKFTIDNIAALHQNVGSKISGLSAATNIH